MKSGLFILCLLCATTALAQSGGAALSNEVQVFQMPSHERHAAPQPMATEQSLLQTFGNLSVQGERPLWEVQPLARTVPLGDVARELKKEHGTAKKADFVRND